MLPTELGNSTRICPKGHGGPNSSQSGESKTEKHSGELTPGTQDVRRTSLTLRVMKSKVQATKPDLHGSEALYRL